MSGSAGRRPRPGSKCSGAEAHFADHRPPHFHARYGEHEVLIAIGGPRVLEGQLPPRALGLVIEWAANTRRSS